MLREYLEKYEAPEAKKLRLELLAQNWTNEEIDYLLYDIPVPVKCEAA